MAFHYGGGAMSVAAISIANPHNNWIEPNAEESLTGKQVLKKAAAGIKKSGREIARTPSRLGGSLRRRSTTLDGETPMTSRPASRLSMFWNVGSSSSTKEGGRSPRQSGEMMSRGGSGANDTPTKKKQRIKSAYASLRKSRPHRAVTAPAGLPSPAQIVQSDDAASMVSTAVSGGEDGYSLCRVPAATTQLPERMSNRIAPSLPLPSFPSMIAMPTRALSEAGSYESEDRDEYSGGEEDEWVGVAVVVRVVRARVVDVHRGDGRDD